MTLTTHTAPVPASQKAEHDSAVPVQRFYRPTLSSKDMHALGPVDGLDASGTLELDRYSQREEEEEEEEPHRPLEPELVQGGQEKDGVPHCSEHVEKSAELRHDVLQSSESVVPLCSEPVGNEELQQPELHSALVQQNNQLVHERNQYGVVQDEQAPGVQYQVQRSVEQQGIKEVQQQQVVHGNSQVEKEVKREQIAPLLSFSTLGAGSDDEMELEFVYPDIQVRFLAV
ncbi:hypothetical protein BDQ17DRAFT_515068 [Cyathus striatus]|nr:hypothetical protein BDQ17DRAFT_515068 [Cyathus striatus]